MVHQMVTHHQHDERVHRILLTRSSVKTNVFRQQVPKAIDLSLPSVELAKMGEGECRLGYNVQNVPQIPPRTLAPCRPQGSKEMIPVDALNKFVTWPVDGRLKQLDRLKHDRCQLHPIAVARSPMTFRNKNQNLSPPQKILEPT